MNDKPAPGKTTIAPEVLVSIAHLTALDVDGVCSMGTRPSSVNHLFRSSTKTQDGVIVTAKDNLVNVDVYVILESDINIRQVSRELQKSIARAFTEMVGMEIGAINIHIEDIDHESAKK